MKFAALTVTFASLLALTSAVVLSSKPYTHENDITNNRAYIDYTDYIERSELDSMDMEARKITKEDLGVAKDGVQLAIAAATGNEVGVVIDAIKLTIDGIIDLFHKLSDVAKQDKLNRGSFTKNTVATLRQKHPTYNFVICHTKHRTKFDGKAGKEWYHDHRELKMGFPVGTTIGYEIYGFKSGEFTRQGDGGWLNWAYTGNLKKSDQGGKHLVFAKP